MGKYLDETGLAHLVGKIKSLISGKAEASHSHSAGDITSGTLPVARGGTGASTAPAARTALGVTPANIGAAAASHNHAASNITSGTLPVSRGGTGKGSHTANAILVGDGTNAVKNVATAAGALYAAAANGPLIFGALPIAHGGTGATTSAGAREKLGLADSGWKDLFVDTDLKTYYRKKAQHVTVTGGSWGAFGLTNSWKAFSTLPEGYRPDTIIWATGFVLSTDTLGIVLVQVGTNGVIEMLAPGGECSYWCFSVTFPLP